MVSKLRFSIKSLFEFENTGAVSNCFLGTVKLEDT